MYRPNFYESTCLRCAQTVYQVDRVGPLKDFTFFHAGCFKCAICGTKLTLKTYYNNQHTINDKEVYCSSHVPKPGPGTLDGSSVGIRSALNVPRSGYVNEQIRAGGASPRGVYPPWHLNGHGSPPATNSSQRDLHGNAGGGTSSPYNHNYSGDGSYQYGRFDASALHIAHALKQTELQKGYSKAREKPIDYYLDRDEQTRLEMKHRKEEDDLYRKFAHHREEEDRRIREEFRDEWEKELEELSARWEREKGGRARAQQFQQEKEDLEKNMTLRRDKKKESLTRKMLEHERAATAALVEKQSSEMLELINEARSEYMRQESLYLDEGDGYAQEAPPLPYPSRAPPPQPPALAKYHIYNDPLEFADMDQIAISVAQEDQKTFTDLVRQLVSRCGSDIEKARTIFRWITVKNLNTMQFDENLRGDTPMGLLRGIKHGTESYHVLFKRLCSYAGLHCVVIKGYSKSAGYQPGVCFEDNRFRNSWNAVYVAGAWRFVQCNWGARHLVNAKEVPRPGQPKAKNDSLRYEYDDHYFLTDPREFIYEFFPLQEEWQLLKQPISLKDFEELPFVRSLFFRYGLYFPDTNTNAVMYTDSTGAATVRIAMPAHMQSSLIFHYNLKFYDNDGDGYDGVSLKRFVMQSVVGNIVAFRVHAPCSGAFLLDIFANAVTPKEYLTGEPMKFKSVCKFKIACEELQTVMVPLPDCASGEWGPTKATRLFGLIPITHQEALVFAGRELEIQFRMSRPLTDFMATLHKNGIEEKRLSKYVTHSIADDDVVTFSISFPEEGQYGLDIYTRESTSPTNVPHDITGEKHLLTHCCKYLINSSKRN
ncbi:hillarin isoform X2 [Bombus vosnesenskii]|uniref:Hillarin isoform X2 n=4 Tax=Bombus TaxID=28641 RepID=A0A6J3LS48_9HYME|nr:hillarin isoform X2 [Bombus terrestris]XP_012240492.1 hillarin isoform X2 [Bombus impatiens]XP_033196923.1 hillarin isoform X2 [Bombus vancouverensis nearcticus]XP_033299194.1 hillarin isoform X2 [Bombus bifarius]XP_033366934.1 hillarin isoform X2 [Bombus vosnesenskii]XP_043591363.1 hillarin isoform X2 [Bombus pyrosoma]XP_050477397.1 hillarin isoform X2 [Bombus huntii]XP_050573097.1 hillarin isoform X2 [Bombus affinis]XP_060819753.1 hillarin isoform X2 [Bombus pascuorum]